MNALRPMALAASASLLFLLFAGCATTRIDWQSRVGNYTYDQAVLELGPPDKSAKIADGTIVADWLTSRGYAYSPGYFAPGYYPWYYGPFYSGYAQANTPDHFLRLTFGPDARLRSWKKYYR